MYHLVTILVFLSAVNTVKSDCKQSEQWTHIKLPVQQLVDLCLFPSDFQFLKRVAFVESKFGCELHNNDNGGIWQMDAAQVARLSSVNPTTASAVSAQLGVDITKINYAGGDLKDTTTAAVAFRSLVTLYGDVPADLQGQANFWARNYKNDPTQANKFIYALNEMAEVCGSTVGDVIFVIDSSGSIGGNFGNVIQFVDAFINSPLVKIDPTQLEIGLVDFSDNAQIVTQLQQYTSKDQLQEFLRKNPIPYFGDGTNMYDGLVKGLIVSQNGRNYNNGSKNPLPQAAVLITDGLANEGAPDPIGATRTAAQDLIKANVELYTVGVGGGVDARFLTSIASPSGCAHYYPLTNYQALAEGFINELLSKTCYLKAVLDPNGGEVHSAVQQNETRYFSIAANVTQGLTIKISTTVGSCVVYVSKTDPNPSEYSYDMKLEGDDIGLGQIYLSPGYLQSNVSKQRILQSNSDSVTVYIAIEGLQETNNISMAYDVGDTEETTTAAAITTKNVPTASPTAVCIHECLLSMANCILCADDIYVCVTTGQCKTPRDPDCLKCVIGAAKQCVGCSTSMLKCIKQCNSIQQH